MGEEKQRSDKTSAKPKKNKAKPKSKGKTGKESNTEEYSNHNTVDASSSSSSSNCSNQKNPESTAPLPAEDENSVSSSSSSTSSNSSSSNSSSTSASSGSSHKSSNSNSKSKNNNNTPKPEFKLRIVPLEKLLAKPPKSQPEQQKENEEERPGPLKRLPARISRRNVSVIELSDSEEESEEEVFIRRSSQSRQSVVTKLAKQDEKPSKVSNCAENSKEQSPTETQQQSPSQLRVRRCVVRLKRTPLLTLTKVNQRSHSMALEAEKPKSSNAKSGVIDSDSEDSEMEEIRNAALSDNAESDVKSSDSEVIPARKKRFFNKRKKNSSDDDSDFAPQPAVKKRGRIKRSNSDASKKSDDDDDDEKNKNKRKHIRKIIKTKDLDISTKTATKEEEERRKRIEERQKLYNQIYEKPENVEVTELVLDFDPETKDPLLQVDKGLLKKLKPHQVAGVKFMWDACFETLKDAEENAGSGCILAHCMGLGKTLQVVTLSHTLLSNSSRTNVERVLIISPLSTLNNWAREFKHWMSFAKKRNIEVYDMSKYKDKLLRIFKLNEWFEEGGVCIIGYDMYRILANEKAKGLRKKQREQLQQALVEPGPDLVICDEGHLLKNEKTSISKAVTKMRTRRRIVLTGTPLQNNLKEYYCMIQFIKPNLLGTYKEYLNRFVNPITNGQYTDSTERDIRLMKHRSHILHKMLEGCIQRRDYSVLAPYLPPKNEYVVYTTLSDLQQKLYEYYMTVQRDISGSDIGGKGARLFQDFQDLRRIWTHPMNLRVNSDTVIRKRQLANDSDDSIEDFICDDDEEEAESNSSRSDASIDSSKSFESGAGSNAGKASVKTRRTRNNKDVVEDSDCDAAEPAQAEDDPSEWWKRFVEEKELNNINHSPKLVVLMNLLQECEAIGDKLLVFSQSLQSLDVIEHFLSLIDSKTKGYEYDGDVGDFKGLWTPGLDYFRLDGSCSVENRESMCKKFNDPSNLRARLFLISTRAGGLGINLVAANRVVIFDVSWNPSHDTQSIFRVYRFGQEKPCYIYRLIAMGTMEQKVYERQVTKQATAKRVIDEQQISRHYNQSDLQELYTYELKSEVKREIPILPKDRLFAELLCKHEELLFKYHEHDSLLENEESENLSESERKAAWAEYEAEKTRAVQTAQYISYDRSAFGTLYGNASGSVTTNKIFGFRTDVLLRLLNMKIAKDHPELTENQIVQLVPGYLQQLYEEMHKGDPTMYKDLLTLHATLAHPSGMYMNPLLYVNQNTEAAGYFQSPNTQQLGGMPQQPGAPPPPPAQPSAGFKAGEVYEID